MATDDALLRTSADGVLVYAAAGFLEDDDALSHDYPAAVVQAVADRVLTRAERPFLSVADEWEPSARPPAGFARAVGLMQCVRDADVRTARDAYDAGRAVLAAGGSVAQALETLEAVSARIRAAHVANLVDRLDPPERRIVRVLRRRAAAVVELEGPSRDGEWVLELQDRRIRYRFAISAGVPQPALVTLAPAAAGAVAERLPFDVVLRAWVADRSRRSVAPRDGGPGVNALLDEGELAAVLDYAESDPEHLRVLRREQIARHHTGYLHDPRRGMGDADWRAVFEAR